MAELAWAVLCTRAIVDRLSSMVSLLDMTDVLWVNDVDIEAEMKQALDEGNDALLVPAKLALVSCWFRSDYDVGETVDCRFLLIGPGEKQLIERPYRIDMTDQALGRQFLFFENLPMNALGVYKFVTERKDGDKWTRLATAPLNVKVRAAAASEPGEPSD